MIPGDACHPAGALNVSLSAGTAGEAASACGEQRRARGRDGKEPRHRKTSCGVRLAKNLLPPRGRRTCGRLVRNDPRPAIEDQARRIHAFRDTAARRRYRSTASGPALYAASAAAYGSAYLPRYAPTYRPSSAAAPPMAANGSYGSIPTAAAVSGMNCAMPIAPAAESASSSYADSCKQRRREKLRRQSVGARGSRAVCDREQQRVGLRRCEDWSAGSRARSRARAAPRVRRHAAACAPASASTSAGDGRLNAALRARASCGGVT